jgi:hypothetical protein
MATIRGPARALCTLGSALLLLTGCDKLTNTDSSDWARAALERNTQLTVVAFDKKQNAFTVRMKDSGELHVVPADQIVGEIPGLASEEGKPKAVSDEPAPVGETTARANVEPSVGQPAATGEIARPDNEVDGRYPAPASTPGTASTGTGVITDPRTGSVLASSTTDDTAQAEAAKNTAAGKKVLASGPGYSITAGDHATPPSSIRLASRSSEIPSPARGIALERRYEPMICQGQQLLHIDGRNLEFEGDAVSAEDGCEIHITNSHIIAHGLGISARAANVHIKNSVIEGESGSVSASQGSQVYTQQSTFKGLSRRLDTATFHDLGGTVWN